MHIDRECCAAWNQYLHSNIQCLFRCSKFLINHSDRYRGAILNSHIYIFRAQSVGSQCLTFITLLYQSTSYFGCRLLSTYSINSVALDVYLGNTQCWFSQSLVLNETKWSGGNIKMCLLLGFCFAALHSNTYREKGISPLLRQISVGNVSCFIWFFHVFTSIWFLIHALILMLV